MRGGIGDWVLALLLTGGIAAVGFFEFAGGELPEGISSEPTEQARPAAAPIDEQPAQSAEARRRAEHQQKLARQIEMLESQQAHQRRAEEAHEQEVARKLEADRISLQQEHLDRSNARIADSRKATTLAQARAHVPIRMYSTTWCPACNSARAYMDAMSIKYTELDVDLSPTARAMRDRLNPKGSVPTIDIDGEVMVGFSSGHLEELIDKSARKRL